MADELSAPLGRKRATKPARGAGSRLNLKPSKLPLARIALGVVVLIAAGVTARLLLVNDPMGGRPVTEIDVNGTRNSNTVADTVSMATITAEPEVPADGPGITIIGDDVPDGSPTAMGELGTAPDGLLAELLEETEHGAIPRVAASGVTPFEAYAGPAPTPAVAEGKKLIAIVVTGLGLNEGGHGHRDRYAARQRHTGFCALWQVARPHRRFGPRRGA